MDPVDFDSASRRLAGMLTRRRALAALLGVATAAMAGEGTHAAQRATCRAVAASCTRDSQCCTGRCRKTGERNVRNRCTCPPRLAPCADGCANLQTDRNHCGACGNACAADEGCHSGHCITECDIDSGENVCITRLDNSTLSGCYDFDPNQLPCRRDGDCGSLVSLNPDTQFFCAMGARTSTSITFPYPGDGIFHVVTDDLLDAGMGVCLPIDTSGACE